MRLRTKTLEYTSDNFIDFKKMDEIIEEQEKLGFIILDKLYEHNTSHQVHRSKLTLTFHYIN